MTEPTTRHWPQFKPDITLGAVIQLIVILGAIVVATVTWRQDLAVKLSEHDLRIAALEEQMKAMQNRDDQFQTEMRGAVGRVTDLLTDVRIRLGNGHDQTPHR